MAKDLPATEFGGKTQKNTIMPPVTPLGHPGHTELTADERLRLGYLTGQEEDSTADPDGSLSFQGLVAEDDPQPAMYRDRWK